MSTEVIYKTRTTSSNETEQLAEKIGQNLKGGETIELVSDLGGGKTTFVRGLAKGMGSVDKVASPSFTIKREYYTGDLTMHHFDFYRLHDAGIIQHDLNDVLKSQSDIAVIEWASIVQGVLPKKRATIKISAPAENERMFEFKATKELAYILRGLK